MVKLIIAAAFVTLSYSAFAAEPTFAVFGFPLSPHQQTVLGGEAIEEAPPAAALTVNGMPATPTQMLILMPRHHDTELATKKRMLQKNKATD